ncbi:MAG TPA: HAMP domain-containing sensor histidine kinase [Verrucomicrobiae bacterium]|jgi:signal transduction histidine kinase|nr:HAMP domain-containing sensor histidine kinase [Verrucomicrobiae bacterium]
MSIEKRSRSAEDSQAKKERALPASGLTESAAISQLEAEVALYRKALEQAREEMQGFAYSVSHDLRAPLRAIEGFSKILLDDFSSQLNPEASRFLRHIISNAQQLGNLIEDLLRLYRATKNPPNRSVVDANTICKEAIDDLSAEFRGNVSIQQNELPEVYADPAQLRQIFRELVSNAIKFSRRKPAPHVEISARGEPGAVIFTVRDDGDGFDPKNVKRLFQVFQRFHGADYPGNGVGLAFVKRLVEAHGGCVSGTAVPNSGATFTFTLPRKSGAASAEPEAEVVAQKELRDSA